MKIEQASLVSTSNRRGFLSKSTLATAGIALSPLISLAEDITRPNKIIRLLNEEFQKLIESSNEDFTSDNAFLRLLDIGQNRPISFTQWYKTKVNEELENPVSDKAFKILEKIGAIALWEEEEYITDDNDFRIDYLLDILPSYIDLIKFKNNDTYFLEKGLKTLTKFSNLEYVLGSHVLRNIAPFSNSLGLLFEELIAGTVKLPKSKDKENLTNQIFFFVANTNGYDVNNSIIESMLSSPLLKHYFPSSNMTNTEKFNPFFQHATKGGSGLYPRKVFSDIVAKYQNDIKNTLRECIKVLENSTNTEDIVNSARIIKKYFHAFYLYSVNTVKEEDTWIKENIYNPAFEGFLTRLKNNKITIEQTGNESHINDTIFQELIIHLCDGYGMAYRHDEFMKKLMAALKEKINSEFNPAIRRIYIKSLEPAFVLNSSMENADLIMDILKERLTHEDSFHPLTACGQVIAMIIDRENPITDHSPYKDLCKQMDLYTRGETKFLDLEIINKRLTPTQEFIIDLMKIVCFDDAIEKVYLPEKDLKTLYRLRHNAFITLAYSAIDNPDPSLTTQQDVHTNADYNSSMIKLLEKKLIENLTSTDSQACREKIEALLQVYRANYIDKKPLEEKINWLKKVLEEAGQKELANILEVK